MLGGLGLSGRTFFNSGAGEYSDHHLHDTLLFSKHQQQLLRLSSSVSYSISLQLNNHNLRLRSKSPVPISCSSRSFQYHDDDDDYLEASVLITETLMHYQMRIQGYQEAIKWMPTGKLFPLPGQGKGPRTNIPTIGPELLSQFRSPTIFLKISCECDEDYLLPILVGESAVERLISSSLEDEGFPNQFQLVRNITWKLGYEARREKINARMELLQELVPGCNKGTAMVLDEIINHVQSLQHQVEIKPKGVTMTALLAKATTLALVKHPVVNSTCRDGKSFTYNSNINIVVAFAIDGGLITPVLQNADKANFCSLLGGFCDPRHLRILSFCYVIVYGRHLFIVKKVERVS